MYQTQRFSNSISVYYLHEYLYQIPILIGFMILLLASNSASALATNPGAVCSANFSQGSLTNADYTNLISAVNTDNYVNIAGNASGSIPLQIRMTTSELNGPPTSGSFNVQTIGRNNAFNILRDFPSVNSVTSIDLDFRNSITSQPIFLTNVAMSAFDIDFALNDSNAFDDYVLFSGVTASGDTINGSYQSLQAAGSNIRPYPDSRPNTPGLGLYTLNTNTATECPGNNLNTECQGSIQFAEPVSSVKIRYSNANYRTSYRDPTNQQVFFRVDNYCYVPQYIFSGTVFDDNGGIPTAQADANQPNFTTGTYNNANYFNGVFNSPPESGIAGSTVRLVSCSNTSTIYATQPSGTGATIGKYQFSVPLSTFGTNRSICLIESRTGATYPVRTTSDNINTGFTTTTYHYPNRNFGRVIPENAALVLRKFQFVNDCSTALNYNNITTTSDPRTGFSTEGINGNIVPGQCIAYRITATNRANTPITNSVVQDRLQEKGQNGALVTSILANPVASTTDYASDSVPIGQNGLVKTNPFPLNQRTSRDFYFNTKYGTTNGNP